MSYNFTYPPIENHGVLLNNRTATLISSEGSVDFACFPNFDSLPVFFSLLDSKDGGYFKIEPLIDNFQTSQEYETDTNILKTNFFKEKQRILSILDFLPMTKENSVYFSEIHRRIEALSDLEVKITFAPFATKDRKNFIKFDKKGYLVKTSERSQFLSGNINLENIDGKFQGNIKMKTGQVVWLVSAYNLTRAYSVEFFNSDKRLWETRKFWKEWIIRSKYQGVFYETVNRSLLILKGLFFEPTGFMVAAATTSLPESIGGERNWDYRYMWIRDTAYVIEAMAKAGFVDEAMKFYLSIIDRYEKDGRLYSLYPISEDGILKEEITQLPGYENTAPVRFGNDAHNQLQIDQYASFISGLRILIENGGYLSIHTLEKVLSVGEKLEEIWNQPDSSIWEIRGEKRNFVYSKLMAWKAFVDLGWLSSSLGMDELKNRYDNIASQIRLDIINNGISKRGYYSQSYGSDEIDASLLRMPLVGFCDFSDPIYVNTFNAIEKFLMKENFLFKRYTLDDGLRGEDNAFLMLTYWYIRNLMIAGNIDKASNILIGIIDKMNSLGILPEELEFGTGRYLGNYPQALSHLSLVLTIFDYNQRINNINI